MLPKRKWTLFSTHLAAFCQLTIYHFIFTFTILPPARIDELDWCRCSQKGAPCLNGLRHVVIFPHCAKN